MDCSDCRKLIDLLKREVVPALGCTEPVAVALAAARAREVLQGPLEGIEVWVSCNIFKNGMGVGIPGTGMTGLDIAAALGAVGGNPKAQLEVLQGVNQGHIQEAKDMIKHNQISVKHKQVPSKLYVEVICKNAEHASRCIIQDQHSKVILVEQDGKKIFEYTGEQEKEVKKEEKTFSLSVEEIYDFATTVSIEEIEFLECGVKMNKEIALEGLRGDYGLQVGKQIMNNVNRGLLGEDIQTYAMALTAAASDARMAGCVYPVMSNSGSGNQGITVMLPVIAVAEKLKIEREKSLRALALSNLIAIHIKTHLGRLSALCGCVVASAGASCGITYLLGGELNHIQYAIKNMIGNISGMICDGAKTGCALKVSTGVSAAIQSALLAIASIEISEKDGIIDKDVEKTIENLANIGVKGMAYTDELILDIMVCK